MNKEAKNMEAIYKAKKQHDTKCVYGGIAVRIYMSPFDIDRMGWEEGDTIAGMKLLADSNCQTGRFRVECDNEPKSEPEVEITEDVKDEDLVHV